MASWTDIKQQWSAGWKQMHRAALSKFGPAIKADPTKFRPHLAATLADLSAARTHLERIKAQIPRLPDAETKRKYMGTFQVGWKRYHELAAGLYADSERGKEPQVSGFVIPLLVVAGIAFGVAAIAWAIASREHSKNLREQTPWPTTNSPHASKPAKRAASCRRQPCRSSQLRRRSCLWQRQQ